MNAHTPITAKPRPWHWHSGVIACEECDGKGSRWNGRGLGGNDPDSWDIDCEACDGVGHDACRVCGFDTRVDGFDCLVCSTVAELTAAEVKRVDPATLADAFTKALTASIAQVAA